MEAWGNFVTTPSWRRVGADGTRDDSAKKHVQTPVGCEGHFTRQQAADALGFASEFKIRAFERKGLLRAVRGPMRAAFYPGPKSWPSRHSWP